MEAFMKKHQKKITAVMLALTVAVSNLAVQSLDVEAAVKATSLKLNATKKTLYVGQSITLKVKRVTPSKASKAVTWTTSSKKIATVNAKGKVTAKKVGTAKIIAISKSNKKTKAVCKITVIKKEETTGAGTNVAVTAAPAGTVTNAPASQAPAGTTTNAPASQSPAGTATNAPASQAPTGTATDAPASQAPTGTATDAPSTVAPTETTTDAAITVAPTETATNVAITATPSGILTEEESAAPVVTEVPSEEASTSPEVTEIPTEIPSATPEPTVTPTEVPSATPTPTVTPTATAPSPPSVLATVVITATTAKFSARKISAVNFGRRNFKPL